jgi:DNA-binding beta-propeller fold protein YncE
MGKGSAAPLFAPGLLALCFSATALGGQQPPQPTQLPGDVFVIKNTWYIGGAGPWHALTMDVSGQRLFIAHGSQVQAVDVTTGVLAGQLRGFQDANGIALDPGGELGYVSDALANQVRFFNRRTFESLASVSTGPGPRALAFEPQTGLLFAICTTPVAPQPDSPFQRTANREVKTSISVIDVAARRRIGEILMPGHLGFAQADGNGMIYVLIADHNQVARLDAGAIASQLHAAPAAAATADPVSASAPAAKEPDATTPAPVILDWSHESRPTDSASAAMAVYGLGSACRAPLSLAVDGAHQRVFAACDNMRLVVLNGGTGEVVTTLPIGPGAQAVGYDAGRGLIYTANGDAQGTLTIIRQDVTDTYNVIQNLPTRQRARTLAVDSDTGQIFLVTDYAGVNLAQPGGIGTLKAAAVSGSFQVLVVGH